MTFRIITALIVALWTPAAISETFHIGDVIVSTVIANDPNIVPFKGAIRQFGPDGVMIREVFAGDYTAADIKFSPQGILHAAAGSAVLRFTSDGSALFPLQALSAVYVIQSLAFSDSGELYATVGDALKFGPDGDQQAIIPLQTQSRWADLGIDQCTLFHLRGSPISIGRFDVCNHLLLTPLPTQLGDSGRTLLVLRDGSLLASTSHSDIYRIGQDGTILRHYTTHAVAYARDISPSFVWVALGQKFAKLDLQNDVIVAGPFDSGPIGMFGSISGIAVVGADASTIPALSPMLLALLALGVAIFAILRLRS